MPTKAQTDNLKKGKATRFSSGEVAVRNGRKGGLAKAAAEEKKKLLKEEILKEMGEADWQKMVRGLIDRATESDRAFEVLRDTIGQKPVEKVESTLSFDLGSAKFVNGDQ